MLTENAALALGLTRAEALMRKRLEAPLAALGTGYTDFIILAELDAVVGGRLRPVDLAGRLAITPSGITRALAPLAAAGLIARTAHERDARASYVELTAQGRARLNQAMSAVDAAAGSVIAGLTRADRLSLVGMFERLSY